MAAHRPDAEGVAADAVPVAGLVGSSYRPGSSPGLEELFSQNQTNSQAHGYALPDVFWDYLGMDQRYQEIPVLYEHYLIVGLDYMRIEIKGRLLLELANYF